MSQDDNNFFKDYQALAQQSWNAWNQWMQQASAGMPGTHADSTPGSAADATVERALAGMKGYFSMLESMAGSISSNGTQRWQDWLKQSAGGAEQVFMQAFDGLNGRGAHSFDSLLRPLAEMSAPFQKDVSSWLGMPAFGFAREQQEAQQELARAWMEYAEQNRRYTTLLASAGRLGAERVEEKLAEHAEPGRQIDSLRALYDLWIDAGEEAYAEIALGEEFREVYGALVNAQTRVRKLMQEQIEQISSQVGIPTRSEVDSLGRRLQETRRELKRERRDARLEDELAALRAEFDKFRREVAAGEHAAPARSRKKAGAKKASAKKASVKKAGKKTAGKRAPAGKKTAAGKRSSASKSSSKAKDKPASKRSGTAGKRAAKSARKSSTARKTSRKR